MKEDLDHKLRREKLVTCLNCQHFSECPKVGAYEECVRFKECKGEVWTIEKLDS